MYRLRPSVILVILAISASALRKAADIPPPFLANGRCRVIISEINIYPGGGSQFIELMRVCHPEPKNVFNVNMDKKYKLIFIDHSGFLVGVCDLKGEARRRNGKFVYYVIGGSQVKNVDMPLSQCEFAQDVDNYDMSNLPDANKAPVSVMLVHHPRGSLTWLALNEDGYRKYKVPITNDLEEKIIPVIVDMYIYTTYSPYTSCDYFGTYYDGYKKDQQLILRDWVPHTSDRTLSRCNPEEGTSEDKAWDPLQPQYFKYAKESPGDNNECKTAVTFRVEDSQQVRDPPVVNFRTTPEYACYITTLDPYIDSHRMITSAALYHAALTELIEDIEHSQQETPLATLPLAPVTLEVNSKPNPMDQVLFEEELAKSIPHTWADCEKFEHKAFISELRGEKIPFVKPDHILRKDVCNWLEYIAPHSFRCKLCNSLWNQEIIFDRPASHLLQIVKKPRSFRTGKSPTIAQKNKQLMDKHLKGPMHRLATDYFRIFDEGKRGSELYDEFYREDGPMRVYLKPTENQFVAVFQATRMDIPFYKYPIMGQTLIYYGVDIGHLYHNPTGAKTITMSISATMHDEFVEDLLKRKPELSILIDTATDVATISSLAILIQTYDVSNRVVVKLYKLLPAGRRESGENLFSMFTAALAKDGLTDYVKAKCVGFASDGGSNVKKFRRLLQAWTANNLITVHCFAHKLNLALQHSWEEMSYLQEVDEAVNGLYRIFNSRSHTKKALLYETAEELGYNRFELKRIVPTRWINTKRRAISTVLVNWRVLVKATEAVIDDRTTKRPQREQAKYLDSSLKDPTLIATMAFIADVCEELAAVSAELQRRGGTLIAKKEMRTSLISRLTHLKTENGPKLQSILDKAVLPEHDNRTVRTVEEFETEDVELESETLHPYELDENSLQNNRNAYIDSIVEEINLYFPDDATDKLDILDPRKWTAENLQNFGNAEILLLNEELHWNYPPVELLQNFIDLKTALFGAPEFGVWQRKKPEEFWTHFLNPGSGITWPASLETVITNVLVTPASTAEVERIFSLYTNIKTVQRYSLDVTTVEALIRIKFNGPKDLREFDAPKYARKFILDGHSRADDESRRGKKRTREDSDVDDGEISGEEDIFDDSDDNALFGDRYGALEEDLFNGDEIEVAYYEDDYDSIGDATSIV